MLCSVIQDGWVIVKSSDKMWSFGKGNGKPPQCSCCKNPVSGMKRQKGTKPDDKHTRSKDVHHATGEEQRAITNRFRKKEVAGPKWKQN